MQANQDPNWTDDAAFWDEAWEDMSRRLDEQPKRRVVALPWWQKYGIIPRVLVLSVLIALPFVYQQLNNNTSTPQAIEKQIVPERTEKPSNQVVAEKESTASATMPLTAEHTATSDKPTSGVKAPAQQAAVTPAPARQQHVVPPNKQLAVEQLSNEAFATASPKTVNVPKTPVTTTQAAAGARELLDAPRTEGKLNLLRNPTATAIARLSQFEIPPLANRSNWRSRSVAAAKKGWRPRLFVDAGTSTSFNGLPLGNYLGLGADLPLGKKFILPVSVRYRKDYLAPRSFPEGRAGTDEALVPVTGVGSSADRDTVTLDFTPNDLERITTRGIEASIGLGWKVSSRFSVQTRMSSKFLFSAFSSITQELQAEYLAGNEQVFFNDLGLINNTDLNRNLAASPITEGSSGATPEFNRWMLRAELGLSYRLNNRLSVQANGRHLLVQPDETKTIGVKRSQLDIGVRWRIH